MSAEYGLIFDVDGLIADTEPINAKVTIRVLREMFGLTGVRYEDFVAGYGKGAEAYVKAGARVHGLELTAEQAQAAAQRRERYLMETVREEGLPAFPGVLRLIHDALADDAFRLSIATSASQELSQVLLEAVHVPYQQMSYVSGSDVTKKKPDPEIFLIAIRRLGLAAGRCVVFEDAPSGVQAAQAAGARCIAVTNTVSAEQLAGADLICDSLERVSLDTIRNLVGDTGLGAKCESAETRPRAAPPRHSRREWEQPMIIRSERESDRGAIAEVTKVAFENLAISPHTEQFIIDALRAAGALTISLVAEIDGRVVGHVAFSPVVISDGNPYWYGLGPVSVLPQHQRQGIGTALINEGLSLLRARGAQGCVLVGDPAYYQRLGFRNLPALTLAEVPPENFLGLAFGEEPAQGSVVFHRAFSARG